MPEPVECLDDLSVTSGEFWDKLSEKYTRARPLHQKTQGSQIYSYWTNGCIFKLPKII